MSTQMFHNEPLAKPSGITLAQHTADVVSEAMRICEKLPSSITKYNKFTHKSLCDRLKIIATFHDKGKICSKWQHACVEDYNAYLQWKQDHNNADFATYSKSEFNEAGKHLRRSGVRHEFYSLQEAEKTKMPISLLAAIAAHHAKLSFGSEERWQDFSRYWNLFKKQSYDVSENYQIKDICKYIFEYNGLRGLLQLADHRASALEDGEYTTAFKCFSYSFPFAQKRGIQKLVETEWHKNLLLVRAPTGAGKTDAALLWASKQIEAGKADRLVIAMPTRFTANALAINVSETLSETGIYHSSAWYNKHKDVEDGMLTKQEALASHKMARLLASPITVTTIDHLLMSLTQTREDHHLINFNLANSCVVIDEADFYDDFTMANIQFLLKMLKNWEVPVLVMSASIPNSALSFYKGTGFNVESILEDTETDKTIEKFDIKQINPYTEIFELKPLFIECLKRKHGIIYMNTIDKAIDAYNQIKEIMNEFDYDVPLILYHSRFTEPDKAVKEKQLLDALGKSAWSSGKAYGIAILTQIGEISINISTDIMISDICPIDRLMQRVGRLCRFDNKKGELHILIPQKGGKLYPAPYGCIKNKSWEASISLEKTIKIIHKGVYTEMDLLNALNSVYESGIHFSDKAITNVKVLQEMVVNNWLINPKENHDERDNNTDSWKSRNIGPQDVIFTESPPCKFFINYSDFMNFQLEKSLAIPLYFFEKLQNKVDLKTIYIANETKKIYVIREGFYNDKIGLKLSEDNNDNFL